MTFRLPVSKWHDDVTWALKPWPNTGMGATSTDRKLWSVSLLNPGSGIFLSTIPISPGSGIMTSSRIWPTNASESTKTGVRYCSERLKASMVWSNSSCGDDGATAIISYSPWEPRLTWRVSPCSSTEGIPVVGPPRCTSTITQGVSVPIAYPTCSCMRLTPGPLVAVIAFFPVHDAPITAASELISSSIWMKTPFLSTSPGRRTASLSETSVAGVMG